MTVRRKKGVWAPPPHPSSAPRPVLRSAGAPVFSRAVSLSGGSVYACGGEVRKSPAALSERGPRLWAVGGFRPSL